MPVIDSAAAAPVQRFAAWQRALVVVLLGFASGLPLALTGQAMQAWLTMEGLDVATIGFLTLVGLPYTFKFLWAPLMDRFDLPCSAGAAAGWSLTQLLLAAALVALAGISPHRRDAGVRAAGGGGGLRLGVAGRRDRRLPHRPAAGARARHRRIAERRRVPRWR